MSTRGDFKKMMKAAKRRGWLEVSTSQNAHVKLRWVNGACLTISTTPSDYRAFRNIEADLRRIERA